MSVLPLLGEPVGEGVFFVPLPMQALKVPLHKDVGDTLFEGASVLQSYLVGFRPFSSPTVWYEDSHLIPAERGRQAVHVQNLLNQ